MGGQNCSICYVEPEAAAQPNSVELSVQIKNLLQSFRKIHMQDIQNMKQIKLSDGALFRGVIKNEQKTGYGEYFSEKAAYLGYFESDLPEGEGILVKNMVDYYWGEFKAGRPHGQGKEKVNGYLFEGRYQFGHRVQGTLKTDSFSYSGFFCNNKFEGQGLIQFASGETYQGVFRAGKYEGKGIFKHLTDEYQGEFKNGNYHGSGKYKWQDGSQYVGQYNANKRSGYGKFKHKDYQHEGRWQEGVKKEKDDKFDLMEN